MNDAEYVLRFLTLRERLPQFSGMLAHEMNDFMELHQHAEDDEIAEYSYRFSRAITYCKTLSRICSDVGTARVSLHDDFQNLVRVRNKCAHDSATNVPTADLESHLETVTLFGIAIDLAITHAIECFSTASKYSRASDAANKLKIKVRFLDQDSGHWRERSSGSTKTIRLHPNLNSALAGTRRPKDGYVVRDARLIPQRLL